MEIKFTSRDSKIQGWIEMAHLISYLESNAKREDKVIEIKLARAKGLITEDEAIDLAVEFI